MNRHQRRAIKKAGRKINLEQPKRDIKAIIQDYADLCANIGELKYKIKCMEKEIDRFMARIDVVQAEGDAVKKEMAAEMEAKEKASQPTEQVEAPVATPEETVA